MASLIGVSSLYQSPTQSSLLPTEIATTSQFFGAALKTTAVCLRTAVKPTSSSLFVISASIVTPNSVENEGALKRSDGMLEAVGVDFDRGREEDVLAIANLGLPQVLVDSLLKRGITQLFPIQRAVLVPALEGRDIIARAKTGTGKTLAFGIPIIKRISIDHERTNNSRRFGRLPRFLVLAPTRELARQVEKEIKDSAPYLNTVCVYGGVSYTIQQNALSRGVDVVVGTPGRIIDLVNGRSLKLNEVQYLVLDEADQMLAVGFEEDVELILENLPAERQSMLFSATMPIWVKKLARKYLDDPLTIDLVGDQDEKLAEGIKLYAIPTSSTSKRTILSDLVTVYGKGGKAIVFTQTKRDADEVSLALTSSIASEALHGDISQHQRERTLNGFRQGKFTVLVATDVAARGLDIPNVDLIVHYELPNGPETFVHRSGRTGRAGKEGRAIVMFTGNQRRILRSFERDVGCRFEFISPPQIGEILESSAEQVIATLQGVHPESIQYFLPTAKKMIKEKGNDALAAALAHLSGFSQPPSSRSLISHEKGWVTLQLKRDPGMSRGYLSARNIMGFLADVYPSAADSVGKILIIADLMIQGAVFDLPEEIANELLNQQIPPGNTITKISKLPELQDDSSRSNYGRFSNSDRGSRYGFRGGSNRNYSGRGSRSSQYSDNEDSYRRGGRSGRSSQYSDNKDSYRRGGRSGRSSQYSDNEDSYRRDGRSGRYSDDEDSYLRGGRSNFRSDNWSRNSSRDNNDWLIGGNRRPIRSPSSGNRERSFAGACFNCGRSGHRASDCPNK